MNEISTLPLTPDFETWPVDQNPVSVETKEGALVIDWADGKISHHHALLLAENDPSLDTLHPLSRESILTPGDLPDDLNVTGARILTDGAIEISWSHRRRPSCFHPGWLRGNAWIDPVDHVDKPILWTGLSQPYPPTFDGPSALRNEKVFYQWLSAVRDHGVARLEGLPNEDGLLVRTVERIGPIRESNFGRMYTLEIKDVPDSNAFTSRALPPHIDMPTRECPHGLQFLFCRENTVLGGEGIYVDGFKIAEDMAQEEPDHFAALCEIEWTYNNRSKTSSYKATGPVVERSKFGAVSGIRYNTWLRSPLAASLRDQDRGYRSYRAFEKRVRDPAYQMTLRYRSGDLVAFDNRRVLHGRAGYQADVGTRFIEGIYADRDDLYSTLRILSR